MYRVLLLLMLVMASATRTDARSTSRIAMLGDSLTARGDWDELLAREVANHGVDGDTIRGATRRVPAVTTRDPELVFVMLGINDLARGRAPAHCVKDMERLLARLRAGAPDARVIVASVLPVGPSLQRLTPKIAELNAGLRALCRDVGCAFLDVATSFADEPGGLSPDDLHLSDAGYRAWAAVIRGELATR